MSQGNDLISRDKAIELVARICNDILTSCKSHYDEDLGEEVYDDIKEFNAVLKCNKDIRTALRKLPAERKWTPISEGLPEERINENTGDFEYVLCTTTSGDVIGYKFGTRLGGNVPHFFNGLGGTRDDRVVAWMYLPDAYGPAEETIVYCKDCKKHNIGIGDFWEEENGNRHWYLKDETCPLIAYRGKAKGHEFDYQYCCCGKEKDE